MAATPREADDPNPATKLPMRRRWRWWLVASIAMICLVALAVETTRRNGLYWYDVGEDYRYELTGEMAAASPVEVDTDGFEWPRVDPDWDTAYLRLRMRSTLFGRWFEPSIQVIEPGGRSNRQTFERGLRGERFVEVGTGGTATVRPGSRLGLVGSHLRWEAQSATLWTFRNPSLDDGPILVVAPHPDDAEIAAFGVYRGRDAWIVTLSAGDYVDGRYGHLASSIEQQKDLRGRVRVWDSIAVPLWGGVPPSRSIQLGLPNGSIKSIHDTRPLPLDAAEASRVERYRQFNVNENFRCGAVDTSWNGVVQDLVRVIEAADPEVILVPHPTLDVAPDHRFTTLALLDALDRLGAGEGWLLLYTNHHVHGEHYPFGPADARTTIPPSFDPGLPVRSVLSYSLSEDAYLEKVFALEAMHDLRAAPVPILGGPLRRSLDRLAAVMKEFGRDPAGTYDYLRRAARPNEVFLVLRWNDRAALRAYAEGNWPARDAPTPPRRPYD